MGRVYFPWSRHYINSEDIRRIKGHLEDGDIILSRTFGALTHVFIPGFWKHASVHIDGQIFEAVGDGVRSVSIDDHLIGKDDIVIIRYPKLFKHGMVAKAESFVGVPYDYSFRPGRRALYCVELAMELLSWGGYPSQRFEHDDILGQPVSSADDLLASPELVEVSRYGKVSGNKLKH